MGCRLLFEELKVLLAMEVKYSFEKDSIADNDESLSVGRLPTLTMECTLLFVLASMILAMKFCWARSDPTSAGLAETEEPSIGVVLSSLPLVTEDFSAVEKI